MDRQYRCILACELHSVIGVIEKAFPFEKFIFNGVYFISTVPVNSYVKEQQFSEVSVGLCKKKLKGYNGSPLVATGRHPNSMVINFFHIQDNGVLRRISKNDFKREQ